MVANDPVGVGGGVGLALGRLDLALEVLVQPLEETLAEVHIADGVDALGELDGAGQLSVAVAPVVLDTFQVPLVYEHHDFVAGGLVYFGEQLFVLLVHEDFLELGEESRSRLREPVYHVLVQALLCKGSGASQAHLLPGATQLIAPESAVVLVPTQQVVGQVHPRLVVQALPGFGVELTAGKH